MIIDFDFIRIYDELLNNDVITKVDSTLIVNFKKAFKSLDINIWQTYKDVIINDIIDFSIDASMIYFILLSRFKESFINTIDDFKYDLCDSLTNFDINFNLLFPYIRIILNKDTYEKLINSIYYCEFYTFYDLFTILFSNIINGFVDITTLDSELDYFFKKCEDNEIFLDTNLLDVCIKLKNFMKKENKINLRYSLNDFKKLNFYYNIALNNKNIATFILNNLQSYDFGNFDNYEKIRFVLNNPDTFIFKGSKRIRKDLK